MAVARSDPGALAADSGSRGPATKRNARIHHQGVTASMGARVLSSSIAGKHFGAAHEARAVDAGEQRAVAALLFRVPPPGLGLALGFAFEKVLVRSSVTVCFRLNNSVTRSNKWFSMASRWAISTSETR